MDKMKKIKSNELEKILIIVLILLIGFLIGFSLIRDKRVIKTEDQQNLAAEQISANRKQILENYLQTNISQLSPEKEVLGGKFYITNIEYKNSDQALISYEDGHIALKAEIKFKIENNNIEIIKFKLINENGVIVTDEHMKCSSHNECVPLPGCHSYECINKKYLDNYPQPDACIMIYDNCAAYENKDCMCQQGICFNENLMSPECNQ